MIVLHAMFPMDPASRDEAFDLFENLVEESQKEAGVIDYRAATDISDPNVVRFFEQYEDEAAFESHMGSEHVQAFQEALPDLLGGEPEVRRFEVESATDLEL
jgi:quinol monooxygenase YgiN